MEKIFDFSIDMMMPIFSSTILQSMDNLQEAQDPPYSDGVYFLAIRKEIIRSSGMIFSRVMPVVLDPVFANVFRTDVFFANSECTKFSTRRIDENWFTLSECIAKNYPGYKIDPQYKIRNKSDKEIDLVKLKKWFLSKDMKNYDKYKRRFLGK